MALSDCVDCWETPCVCGGEYKDYSDARKLELIKAVLGVSGDGVSGDDAAVRALVKLILNKPDCCGIFRR